VTEAQGRAAVVAEAKTWLGTPWHHRGRLKGVGVDCAQFVIGAYVGAGVIADIETGEYPRDWHVHKDIERFVPFVLRIAREIDVAAVQPADLLVYKIGHVYSHGALVLDWPLGIHAAVQEQIVTLCDLDRDAGLITPARRAFTLKEWP